MNVDLWKALLDVEAESIHGDPQGGVANDPRGEDVFARFCYDVLNTYRRFYPGISRAWVSVAGIEPGCFTPIAALPKPIFARIPKLDRKDAWTLATNGMALMRPLDHEYLYVTVPDAAQVLVIRLVGYEEYHGILVFGADDNGFFSDSLVEEIEESSKLLNRLMAEAVFSKRLKTLAGPISFQTVSDNRESVFDNIARQACLGLAADGSVLRIRVSSDKDPSGYILGVKGQHGLLAGEQQFEPGSVFERVCQRVFTSLHFVTMRTLKDDGSRLCYGAHISTDDDDELREFGIQAYMIIKLQSDLQTETHPIAMGTLSVFHRLPQVFSRRDISLFRGFGERVADDLALMDQRDENQAISRLLEAQNSLGTRAEIVALLGHDFGHRVYHIQNSLEEFTDICSRNWPQKTLPERIRNAAERLKKDGEDLAEMIRQIRLLGVGTDEAPTTFDVFDVFKAVREQLRTVLERYNMTLEPRIEGDCRLRGVKSILLQALFNLVINSIDAQKASGHRKSNSVHLTCREVGSANKRKLEFKVWDDGPGINRSQFPDAQRIFAIGTTSKPSGVGTGTGLPAARSLLGRYFHADLQLVDRSKALFQFSIPAPQ